MDTPPPPLAPNLRSLWMLDPTVTFLNHGSFGAVPREVFEHHNDWRRKIEANPVEIIWRNHDPQLAASKQAVGEFLGMRPADFGFVTNATEGVNAILQSIDPKPGDELLTTNHVYNAVRQAMKRLCDRTGAVYREIPVPTPLESPDQITAAVTAAITSRTRLLVIDHVTSPTAIVFPAQQIVAAATERGVDVLVDGAHAPGMLDLNVAKIGAAYYTGNLHKWCCAPKGSAFLYVRPDRQAAVHPAVISHHYGQGFIKEFDWQGTRDLAAWHATPKAIEFLGRFDWRRVREHNHAMAAWAHRLLCRAWAAEALTPLDGSMLGSMATVALPGKLGTMTREEVLAFQQRMFDEDRVEAPFMFWQERWHLRVSCQVYNEAGDYERVAGVIQRRAS